MPFYHETLPFTPMLLLSPSKKQLNSPHDLPPCHPTKQALTSQRVITTHLQEEQNTSRSKSQKKRISPTLSSPSKAPPIMYKSDKDDLNHPYQHNLASIILNPCNSFTPPASSYNWQRQELYQKRKKHKTIEYDIDSPDKHMRSGP